MNFSVYEVLLKLPELRITGVEIEDESVHIFCKKRRDEGQICPTCKKRVQRKTPKYIRKIRDLNISGKWSSSLFTDNIASIFM